MKKTFRRINTVKRGIERNTENANRETQKEEDLGEMHKEKLSGEDCWL